MTNTTTDPDDRARLATERVASAFRWDADLEALAADPTVLKQLPPAKRVALGHYLTSKAAARSLGVDVTGPTDAPTTDPKETR
jgi:hypothetical protein